MTNIGALERPQRPALSFPWWLSLVLFLAALAESMFVGHLFFVSPDYRKEALVFGGSTLVVAVLIWLWVLGASRRFRRRTFAGPIQTVRGGDSMVQPVTAPVFLAVAAWIAYSSALPLLTHVLDDQVPDNVTFVLAGAPGPVENGCRPVRALNETWGDQTVCVPENLFAGPTPPESVVAFGDRSTFVFVPYRYALPNKQEAVAPVPEDSVDAPLAADTRDASKSQTKTKN